MVCVRNSEKPKLTKEQMKENKDRAFRIANLVRWAREQAKKSKLRFGNPEQV